MMFAAMFLCSISYGASISELLQGKKNLKLSCEPKHRYVIMPDGTTDSKTDFGGVTRLFEIKDGEFHYDMDEHPIPLKNSVSEQTINQTILKTVNKSEINKSTIYVKQEWHEKKNNSTIYRFYSGDEFTIDRYSGSYTHEWWREWSSSLPLSKAVETGTCTKATEQKF
jgi:hypothetical protein